jgi:hypothetical protein
MICCKGSIVKCNMQEDIYSSQRDNCSVFIVQNFPYQGQRESLFKKPAQRPYLNNFDATCHELTSWDNSSSMSI